MKPARDGIGIWTEREMEDAARRYQLGDEAYNSVRAIARLEERVVRLEALLPKPPRHPHRASACEHGAPECNHCRDLGRMP